MFIVSLTYLKPPAEADRFMEPHMAWLRKGYAGGHFVASGRKNPRTGGVILARGDREAIEALCAADPFAAEGIADYEITEVAFTTVAPGFELLKE